ncbi:MAG: glycosyltransferase family 2 protein [Caldilineaceae bacterium]|nr:glycosyltransferase family 2 protein [Caldilineaceae bacterium]
MNPNSWQPLISVIVPVYNGERFLRAALDSILAQSYTPWELIVVDDGSTDNSAAIVAGLPILEKTRLLLARQPNQGSSAARNWGIELATGELLAFLDADDLWLPHKLERQVAHLAAQPELDGVVGHMESFVEPGFAWPASLNREYYEQRPPIYSFCTLLIRRSAMMKIGLLDLNYHTAEDTEWFFRARDMGIHIAITPEVLFRRRFHDRNISQSSLASSLRLVDIARASLQRRRNRE